MRWNYSDDTSARFTKGNAMIEYYKLEGKKAVPCSFDEGIRQWSGTDRIVAQTGEKGIDKVLVSTVFLPMNHAFGDGPPMVFETMIFGGEHDQWQERCSTWEEAEAMHTRACNLAGLSSPFAAVGSTEEE